MAHNQIIWHWNLKGYHISNLLLCKACQECPWVEGHNLVVMATTQTDRLPLIFSTLWANSADSKLMTFFLFFPEAGFDISCKLSPLETICKKCQILFSATYRNIFFLFFLEKQDLTVHANCLQQFAWTVCWKILPWVLSVKMEKLQTPFNGSVL